MAVTIPIHLDAGDEIADDCLAADVYFGDDKLSQTAVATALVSGGGAERTVRVNTTSLINEPVVTVYLAIGCKAKITRKFVAFADPPGMVSLPSQATEASTAAVQAASAAPVAGSSIKSSVLASNDSTASRVPTRAASSSAGGKSRRSAATAAATSGAASSARAVPSSLAQTAVGTVDTRSASATKRKPHAPEALSTKVDARPRTPEGARLVLDPVEADAVVAPTLMMSAGMAQSGNPDAPEAVERRAAAAALWAAMNASPEQLARDRQRMQDLEQRLARLQQDSAGASKKVAEMEGRVRDAEEHRLRHPLVYALGGACLILAGVVAWLFMRQRRQHEAQGSWWQGDESPDGTETAPAAMAEPALARTSAGFMPVRSTHGADVSEPSASTHAQSAAALPDVGAPAVAARVEPPKPAAKPVMIKSAAQEAAREITVEELIDLEQQAEFFVVLGQDEAAIELLESHIHTTAGASPLPYLKLLEIYQRLDRRADYERVQSAFNGRFNAYAPSWESDLQQGHSLQDYPGVIERLQALWSEPTKAMDVLQMSLTRPDSTAETFDLPAYREVLFLYAVARDLSEREALDRAPVDLLRHGMPADDEGHELSVNVEPLMATRPVKAVPQATPSLALDLSLDDPAPSGPGGFVDEPMMHMDIDVGSAALDSHGPGGVVPNERPAGFGTPPAAGDHPGLDFVPMDLPPRKT